MKEEALAAMLSEVVKRRENWDVSFQGLTVHHETFHVELTYQDSGVGEEYVRDAFAAEWPDRGVDVDAEGGCDSCGYGRTISVTISGGAPWGAS